MPDREIILLVEDNEQLNQINRRALTRAGYRVLTALNVKEAREQMDKVEPDAIILDIMLPDGNGVDFCREIRDCTAAPILILTSVSGYEQTLEGLAAGGDDYLNKPCDLNLLLAKVAAFLRRDKIVAHVRQPEKFLEKGPITLDILAAQAFWNGEYMPLAQKEFELLLFLINNEGKVLSAGKIFESVWRQPMIENDSALKNALSRLRKKIDGSGFQIIAVRGIGYRFEKIE